MTRAWVRYTVIRLGMFLGLLVLLMLLSLEWWIATILAAIIALCLSYIFLAPDRHAIAQSLAERKSAQPVRGADESAEDAVLESDSGGQTEAEQQRGEGGQP